jgi:selenocysteine-specific elongation factor
VTTWTRTTTADATIDRDDPAAAPALRVIATAGHVDHGKSTLIARLTGIDPDRWAEEKRRGLTIDLGYAWCTLPSGREVGFVDVPGHERFIANMLAGVGPVPLVLFVVAADEGWRPQSEEHLQILDVLGVRAGVVAITKRDLVDDASLAGMTGEIRERLAGTCLASAPMIAVSGTSGEGLDELVGRLDALVGMAVTPEPARTRLYIDRVFAIKGAGTVVTGTLTGACVRVGDEVEVPGAGRGRIRSLQTHRRSEDRACPVSRVAANLVGIERDRLTRGQVMTMPDAFRPTQVVDGSFRPVRDLAHPVGARGAYKLYVGTAEIDVRLRVLGATRIAAGEDGYVRLRTAEPVTVDVFDRFVLRESGRRETVGGGVVLDPWPPAKAGGAEPRLSARAEARRDELPALLVAERGAVRVDEARSLTGSEAGPTRVGDRYVREDVIAAADGALETELARFHRDAPFAEGMDVRVARGVVTSALRRLGIRPDAELAMELLGSADERGIVIRSGSTVRSPSHEVRASSTSPEVARVLTAIGGRDATSPPTIPELVERGIPRAAIDAAVASGEAVRVAPDLVFSATTIEQARRVALEAGPEGITVSAFRQALGTSRKFALPILAWFDLRGITRRDGDRRIARDAAPGS